MIWNVKATKEKKRNVFIKIQNNVSKNIPVTKYGCHGNIQFFEQRNFMPNCCQLNFKKIGRSKVSASTSCHSPNINRVKGQMFLFQVFLLVEINNSENTENAKDQVFEIEDGSTSKSISIQDLNGDKWYNVIVQARTSKGYGKNSTERVEFKTKITRECRA